MIVKMVIKNIGKMDGKEIVQLYVIPIEYIKESNFRNWIFLLSLGHNINTYLWHYQKL